MIIFNISIWMKSALQIFRLGCTCSGCVLFLCRAWHVPLDLGDILHLKFYGTFLMYLGLVVSRGFFLCYYLRLTPVLSHSMHNWNAVFISAAPYMHIIAAHLLVAQYSPCYPKEHVGQALLKLWKTLEVSFTCSCYFCCVNVCIRTIPLCNKSQMDITECIQKFLGNIVGKMGVSSF
jgi:hypothetical protein